jgi:hypothetical protein
VLSSIWHTVADNVFWAHGGPRYVLSAVLFDLAVLAALVVLAVKGVGRLRERGNARSSLNPLHHEPLPPFPGTPDHETK